MTYPVKINRLTNPLTGKSYGVIPLWRGDYREFFVVLYDVPPAWEASHSYVAGVVGSGQYLADSTVFFDGKYYTALEDHTSASTFDQSKWEEDSIAVGPPLDLTNFGDTFKGQVRENVNAEIVAPLALLEDGLADGELGWAFDDVTWAILRENKVVDGGFDIQVTTGSAKPTTLVTGLFRVEGDYTYA